MRTYEDKETRRRKRANIRYLRVLLVVFYLCLMLNGIGGYVLLQQPLKTLDWESDYLLYVTAGLVLSFLCVRWLWRCTRLGRVLFILHVPLCAYGVYALLHIWKTLSLSDTALFQLLFMTTLTLVSFVMALLMSIQLWHSSRIYEIYHPDKEELEEETEVVEDLYAKHDRRIDEAARKRMRLCAVLLFLLLYAFLALSYVFLGFMMQWYPNMAGLDYVQRSVLLGALFSILVWSFVAVLLFLYKPMARWCMLGAILAEAIRFVYQLPQYWDIMNTQHYAITSWLMLFALEILRYVLLYRLLHSYLTDVYIKTYWDKRYHKTLRAEEER